VDDPSWLKAIAVAYFNSLILPLTTFPSSPSISPLKHFAISSLNTTPFSLALTLNATFKSSASNTEFILCSAYSGHAMRGTPCTILSNVEFHPQCVKNPAVEP
ncbi:hypothetical protein CFOL_v3_07074, partial [Cephalotus follicularis]